jgi:DNA-binding NarL/FixJ family response regulator
MVSTVNKINVMLVDDHRLLREGLSSILTKVEDMQVVGSVSSGEEAIRDASMLNPDLILMDILMGGMTGIEATRWIKEQNSDVKVILISSEVKKDLITAGIHCGIDGYLPKNVEKEALIEAIRVVMKGGRYFNEAITSLIFEDFYQKKKVTSLEGKVATSADLTKREHEVLAHLAAGKRNREIAEELFISVKTVETHRSHILEKLGLRNTAELVKYAVKNKLLPLD